MKFGKNLPHLSIEEWKDYNLDYNDLKSRIRAATKSSAPSLTDLRQAFVENFDYLNLFTATKSGELSRKLRSDAAELEELISNNGPLVVKLELLDSLHYRLINDVSIELRKLNKFILVQKLAVKKIFKKLAKHYPDPAASKRLISSLTESLYENKHSFMNFDSSDLTTRLRVLLANVDDESKCLHDMLHRRPLSKVPSRVRQNSSVSTSGTAKSSIFSGVAPPEDVNFDVNFDLSINSTAKFDLITALKKNFTLHTLIPNDVACRNDLDLSINVYLNIPKVASTVRVSVVYLMTDTNDENPSRIISYEDSLVSVVIAFTGGLRKYSYCCLPNSVVNMMLSYFMSGENANRKERAFRNIFRYLEDENLSTMTKMTVHSLLHSDVFPMYQMVYDRTRYFLPKSSFHSQLRHSTSDGNVDKMSMSPMSAEAHSETSSTVDNRNFEDNYYMTHDESIHTTSSVCEVISFNSQNMDPFPFNSFCIYSNDSNLHNFETTLSTHIEGNVLQNKFRAITLKKLPFKLQNFLKITSVYLYKNLSLFDYMRSCYSNIMPTEKNNHYSRLLIVNLFKNYENIETVNNQDSIDGSIIHDKSRMILNRQMSYRSLRSTEAKSSVAAQNNTTQRHEDSYYNPFEHQYEHQLTKLMESEDYNEDANEDSYVVYLNFYNDLEENVLNSMILSLIRFKYRAKKILGMAANVEKYPLINKRHVDKYNERTDGDTVYDSINDDNAFLDNSNDYHLQLVADYDYILSLLYLTFCFSAIFIAGINIGILFSLMNMENDETKFSIFDNTLLVGLLTIGSFFSLAFTMASIHLNFHRFSESPGIHSALLWTGFTVVLATIVWPFIHFLS